MQTVASPRKSRQAKPPEIKRVRLKLKPFEAQPGVWTPGVVHIQKGKDANDYFILPLNTDFGRGFILEKVTGTYAESYAVNVDTSGDGKHICDCKGHLKHGHCKHPEALLALIKAGQLPGPSPAPVEPTPMELPTDPDMLTGPAWDQDHYLDIRWLEHQLAEVG